MNMDSARAMRAPGHPQAGFVIESAIDELAYKLALDPLEVRKKNLRDPVYTRQLDRVAQEIGWAAHPNKTKPGDPSAERASASASRSRPGAAAAARAARSRCAIERDGSVTSSVGTQDLGTGSRTYVAAIVAEEFGLQLDDVTARIGSTKLGSSGGSGGSVTTGSLAPAVKDAAFNARNAFAEHVAPTLGVEPDRVRFTVGRVTDVRGEKPSLTWKQACATLPAGGLRAQGRWRKDLQASRRSRRASRASRGRHAHRPRARARHDRHPGLRPAAQPRRGAQPGQRRHDPGACRTRCSRSA